jgi:ribosome modulation factor
MKASRKTIFREGYAAACDGKDIFSCPYPEGSGDQFEWEWGWMAACNDSDDVDDRFS